MTWPELLSAEPVTCGICGAVLPAELYVEHITGEIDAQRTPAGGWTRATLAAWGIGWPPPRGWRQALIAGDPPPIAGDPPPPAARKHPRGKRRPKRRTIPPAGPEARRRNK
jgi:hypothetical protein